MSLAKQQNPNLRQLRNRPVCIICGRPSEAEAIAQALGVFENRLAGDEVDEVNDGHTFYLGSFKLQDGELEYYITSSLRQGIQSFTVNASVLFSILRPRFVVHAGVCAGYDDPDRKLKLQLRDVVLGEAAINYEEGKWENDPIKGLVLRPDYNRVSAAAGDIQAFAESRDRPQYHYGEYISGSAVRADAGAVFQRVRNGMNRNAIALDMEASAFIQLCEHFGNDYAKCLGVVKGISDFGNSEKNKDPTAYSDALKNTARALHEWITHRIRAVNWEVDESNEPGAKIVPGYYKNFVSRVLDNFCQGWDVKLKNDTSVVIPRKEIKGFKTVLPKGRRPAFVSELGNIMAITGKYDIPEVVIGGDQGFRYLYYRAGYLMDWSRCCNSLAEYEDGVYQVEVFERMLRKNQYYSTEHEGPAKAAVCTWEDTVAWLEEVVAKEELEKEGMVKNPKMDDAERSSKRNATGHSSSQYSKHPPQLSTTNVHRTAPGPRAGDENEAVESPRSPNTFPLSSPHNFDDSRVNRQQSLRQPKKKLSFPHMFPFFRKKSSHPQAAQLIKNQG
ncbi:purine and uridine phosphorylase [Lepidopterella palustris CBS 459.81]|uniref:Purine and uridine phosphorylase n=1 Tax=Lepidopterella palustris CBS 459.81 TaxID=1314670 RepID=A0A8E2EAA3_9PEZI|nr:purine and uridine phosphorylase [Lepidopterella palustris CBS 459.81]